MLSKTFKEDNIIAQQLLVKSRITKGRVIIDPAFFINRKMILSDSGYERIVEIFGT